MRLRFLCDENMPKPIVDAIAAAGLDVAWVALLSPGIADRDVLRLASHQGRILVTLDKDFGELAMGEPGPGCGIVLVRPPLEPPAQAGARIAALLASRADWSGHLSVVERGRLRQRPLRKSP